MMQKGKILRKSLFVAVAAASLTAATVEVKAGDADSEAAGGLFTAAGLNDDVSFDASKGVLEVKTSDSAQEILVGTGKAKIKKGDPTGTITVSAWDIYDTGGDNNKVVKVDLSKLKNTVDNYLVLHTNKTNDVAVVKIPIAEKYLKVKFDALDAKLLAGAGPTSGDATPKDLGGSTSVGSDGATSTTPIADLAGRLQYRTAYSGWENLLATGSMPDFKFYQVNGTQLYVRLKAGELPEDQNGKMKHGSEILSYTVGKEVKTVKVYEAPNLPSKEVKVSISAMAKGPSVSPDYTNGTVKIPKKAEYRLLAGNEKNQINGTLDKPTQASDGCIYEYTQATDGKAQSVDSLFPKDADGKVIPAEATLEVRKAATPKKAASKWTRLEIETLKDLVVQKDDRKLADIQKDREDKKTQGYTGEGIKKWKVIEGKTDDKPVIDFDYMESKKNSGIRDGIQITSTSDNDYELYIGEPGTTEIDPNDTTVKIKKNKIAGKGKKQSTIVSLKNLGKKDLAPVWIRKTGNKKIQDWASTWTQLGYIEFDVAPPAPADNGGDKQDTGGKS